MNDLVTFVADLSDRLATAERAANEAWWELSLTSSDDAARRRSEAELERKAILADRSVYAELQRASAGPLDDPLLARQVEMLRLAAMPEQVPDDLRREIVERETAVEATFNAFRGTVDGRPVPDNEIDDVLRGSDDSEQRRAYWEASKQVGGEVAGEVRELARLRNRAAAEVGYRTWRQLALAGQELDPQWLSAMLDQVEAVTDEPFRRLKARLDNDLSRRFGTDDLRPWHYGDRFFQEAPAEPGADLDQLFETVDLAGVTARTYADMGLAVDAAMERSDLLPRDGKSQHAFCIHIDRAGDVRVLSNNRPSERWMATMLHEFGHAAYDLYIDRDLPYLLRDPAHIFTTEGVAMLFGRLVHDRAWLARYAGVPENEAAALADQAASTRRAQLLVFARWGLVMSRFEEALYADPDDAGLDERWWDLVGRLQMVAPPGRAGPDWAAKIHLAVAPVYYHNYVLGELFASQVAAAAGPLAGSTDAGAFLRERIFAPAARMRWDGLCHHALGGPLTADAWGAGLTT